MSTYSKKLESTWLQTIIETEYHRKETIYLYFAVRWPSQSILVAHFSACEKGKRCCSPTVDPSSFELLKSNSAVLLIWRQVLFRLIKYCQTSTRKIIEWDLLSSGKISPISTRSSSDTWSAKGKISCSLRSCLWIQMQLILNIKVVLHLSFLEIASNFSPIFGFNIACDSVTMQSSSLPVFLLFPKKDFILKNNSDSSNTFLRSLPYLCSKI